MSSLHWAFATLPPTSVQPRDDWYPIDESRFVEIVELPHTDVMQVRDRNDTLRSILVVVRADGARGLPKHPHRRTDANHGNAAGEYQSPEPMPSGNPAQTQTSSHTVHTIVKVME